MPDIVMCGWEDCPMKLRCYRYRATPNEYRQAFLDKPPYITKYIVKCTQGKEDKQSVNIKCQYFIQDKN
jgi:hypothetical protein